MGMHKMGQVVQITEGENAVSRKENESAIIARTKQAREAAGMTACDAADALQIGGEAYRKYETRSPLPIGLLYSFCLLVNVEIEWLLNGRIRRPAVKANGKAANTASITEFRPRLRENAN